MPDRAPRGGAFPVDATLRGSRRTRAMRVFRVAWSSRGWNLARRGGHRRRRRDDSRVRPRHRSMPPRDGGPTGTHRGGTRGSSARRVDVSPPPGITCVAAWAGQVVEARVAEACWCGPTRSAASPTTRERGRAASSRDDGSGGEFRRGARGGGLVRALRRGRVRRPLDPVGRRAKRRRSASASRSRSLASSSSPTGCVPSMVAALRRGDGRGGEGRTCRFRVRGRGMPRPPAQTCSRARARAGRGEQSVGGARVGGGAV